MEALVVRARCALLCGSVLLGFGANNLFAASHRTENFIVTASSRPLAREIAEAAEKFRSQLAVDWLGHELPRWQDPCPITAKVSPRLGAGGATSFLFETQEHHFARPVSHQSGDGLFRSKPVGRPFGWEMSVQGSRERVLDSVLPHEVTHAIFATHFGRPLPRWADEGACTTVEHVSEKAKQHRMLYEFLKSDRGIAFNRMFAMNEYPADILPLYSQGFSLSRFLIAQGGRQKFMKYIGDGLDSNNWTESTHSHYGFSTLSELQVTWLDWVRHGSPENPAKDIAPKRDGDAEPVAIARLDAKSRRNSPRANGFGAPRPTEQPADSWYVRQSRAAKSTGTQSVTPTNPAKQSSSSVAAGSTSLVRVPVAHGTRVASRPDRGSHQREVLLEWGTPSPMLNPTLANDEKSIWR